MPVFLAIRCFILVIPNARFHEKLRPGIGVDFFDIYLSHVFIINQCNEHTYYYE